MPFTKIVQIRNDSNYAVTIQNKERPQQTDGIGVLTLGDLRNVSIDVPWCGDGQNFNVLQILVNIGGQRQFAIWQAHHTEDGNDLDRVRVSTATPIGVEPSWSDPGDEIGLLSVVGLVESLLIGGDRTLIINDRSLWLAPPEVINEADAFGGKKQEIGFHISAQQVRRSVDSVPKRSSVAFSMAGRAATVPDITSAYQDSGKRYAFEIRDNVTIQMQDGSRRTANGVVVVTSPGPVPSVLIEGSTPLTQVVSYNNKRIGELVPLPEFDLIASCRGRVFAKEKDVDAFYFASLDPEFEYVFNGARYTIPSFYFKLDPEFNQPNAHPRDLRASTARDYHGHHAAERFSVYRLGLSFGIMETMIVRMDPGRWHLLDMRPPLGSKPDQADQQLQLAEWFHILPILTPSYPGARELLELVQQEQDPDPQQPPVYCHVTYSAADGRTIPVKSVDFCKVLDIGVGHVHFHDQYDGSTGGEMQSLLSTAPPGSGFTEDLPEVYRFLNGPIQDADGFCDGTCNYYILTKLRDNSFRILFTDEQSFFCGRWRVVGPDDYRGLRFALIADIDTDTKRAPPRRFNFNRATYWDPFPLGLVNENSRLAVAAQVLLVNGGAAPNELYSINFSWGTMDRTWRWRQFPPNAAAQIGTGSEPTVDPQTIRLREDMTIHVTGMRKKPDNTIEVGRYYQRYLPAGNRMPSVPQTPGARPVPYTHPWKFLPEPIFALADQFSHLGVYADVNSRARYYRVSGNTQALAAGQNTPWVDDSGQLSTDGYEFEFEWLRNPSLWLPPPKIQKRPPSLFNQDTRLRIVPREGNWYAMLWDKRDDDLIRFSQAGLPVAVLLKNNGQTANVALNYDVTTGPPIVQVACFWFQSAVSPGDTRVGIGFGLPGGAWRVRMAALVPGQPRAVVTLFDEIVADKFTVSSAGFFQYFWTPSPDQRVLLAQYCTPEGALAYGTSIWFEGVTGQVSVPDVLGWQRSPGINASANPSSVPLGRPVLMTVHAQDALTSAVLQGRVLIDGVDVGPTDVPFTHTFHQTSTLTAKAPTPTVTTSPTPEPGPDPNPPPVYPEVTVAVPGYLERVVSVSYFTGTVNAAFIAPTAPTAQATMTAGGTYQVSITMQNTGTVAWTRGGTNPYGLGSQSPQDNRTWGFNRRDLPVDQVAPGQQTTFNFTVTAPATPGIYNFQWRMLQELVEWFGASSPNVAVSVVSRGSTMFAHDINGIGAQLL